MIDLCWWNDLLGETEKNTEGTQNLNCMSFFPFISGSCCALRVGRCLILTAVGKHLRNINCAIIMTIVPSLKKNERVSNIFLRVLLWRPCWWMCRFLSWDPDMDFFHIIVCRCSYYTPSKCVGKLSDTCEWFLQCITFRERTSILFLVNETLPFLPQGKLTP